MSDLEERLVEVVDEDKVGIMLSALDILQTVFQLLKIKLCWANRVLVENACCMLKIWANKSKPKKLSHRLTVLMMLFFCQRQC